MYTFGEQQRKIINVNVDDAYTKAERVCCKLRDRQNGVLRQTQTLKMSPQSPMRESPQRGLRYPSLLCIKDSLNRIISHHKRREITSFCICNNKMASSFRVC